MAGRGILCRLACAGRCGQVKGVQFRAGGGGRSGGRSGGRRRCGDSGRCGKQRRGDGCTRAAAEVGRVSGRGRTERGLCADAVPDGDRLTAARVGGGKQIRLVLHAAPTVLSQNRLTHLCQRGARHRICTLDVVLRTRQGANYNCSGRGTRTYHK